MTDVIVNSSGTLTIVSDVGPQGPQGIQGIQGIQGLKGDKGDTGDVTVAGTATVTATGSTTARTLAARFADTVSVKDFGAVGDGTADDTAAVQAALTAAAGKTLTIPAGTYMLSSKVTVPSSTRVRAEAGAVLKATAGNVSNPVLLEISGKSDVLIEGLTFDGALATIAGFNNVVTVFTASRIVFDRCRWRNCKGISVIFSTSIVDSGVRDSFFDECGTYQKTSGVTGDRKQAISFSSGTQANNKGNFVTGCTFTEVGLDCISFSNQSNGLIQGNKIRGNYAGSIYVPASINVKIIGNDISNGVAGGNGIDVYSSARITISGNAAYSCGAAGIMVAATDDFSIVGNVCMDNWQSGTSVHRGGITLDTDGTSNTVSRGVIAGNRCGDVQGVKTQQYGFHVVASSNDSDIWVDHSNDFSGNAVSDFGGDALGYSALRAIGDELYSLTTKNGTALVVGQTGSASSWVNYVQVVGSLTGAGVQVKAAGSDTNIGLRAITKGTGSSAYHRFENDAGEHLLVGSSTASGVINRVRIAGSATGGGPNLIAEGTDTNIDLTVTPKGTGALRFGTHSAVAAETVTGYITIKDSGGTTRKLAVIS